MQSDVASLAGDALALAVSAAASLLPAVQALAASGAIALVVSEPSGSIVAANAAFLKLIGYEQQDLDAGRLSWAMLTAPDCRHLDVHAVETCLRVGHVGSFEKNLVQRGGKHVKVTAGGARVTHAGTDRVAWVIVRHVEHAPPAPLVDDGNVAGLLGLAAVVPAPQFPISAHELQLATALDAARISLWTWEIASGTFAAEGGCAAVCGPGRATGGTLESLISRIATEDQEAFRRAAGRALIDAGAFSCQFRIVSEDGPVAWIEARGQLAMDSATNKASKLSGVMTDITARRAAEEALRDSEARFRAAAEGSLDAFIILTAVRDDRGNLRDFEFVDMNCRGEDLLGHTRHELRGKRLCEIYPLNPGRGLFQKMVEVVQTRRSIEEELELSEADRLATRFSARWLRYQVVPLADGIALSIRDVTVRRSAELALQQRNAQLAALINASPLAVILLDVHGRVQMWSPAAERIFGWTEDEATGRFHPILQPEAMQEFQQNLTALRSGTTSSFRCLRQHKDGRLIDVSIWATPIGGADGEPAGVLSLMSDITPTGGEASHARAQPPVHTASRADAQSPSPTAAPAVADDGNKRVLLVEDHEDSLRMMSKLLRTRGFEVVPATSLAQAKRIASETRIDLVISDLGLPDGSGIELMSHLREMYGLRGIALTGSNEANDHQRGLAAGFVEHLVKPVDFTRLEDAVRRHA